MSPSIQLSTMHNNTPATYVPTSDAMDRHREYGVTKSYTHSRRLSSTSTTSAAGTSGPGGGRAWSEDEEVYLLQTRLQKMPYKHIAAHLKKTELACRLHYHQLSHGSSRRKQRAASISSTTSSSSTARGQSPIMISAVGTSATGRARAGSMPSPIQEYAPPWRRQTASPDGSRSVLRDTLGRRDSFVGLSGGVPGTPESRASSVFHHQALPVGVAATGGSAGEESALHHRSPSPRLLPAILPKPADDEASERERRLRNGTKMVGHIDNRGMVQFPADTPAQVSDVDNKQHYRLPSTHIVHDPARPLRLECSLPQSWTPPSSSHRHALPSTTVGLQDVDMPRLHAIYMTHRTHFWSAIAAEYGGGVSPAILEEAWRVHSSSGMSQPPLPAVHQHQQYQHQQHDQSYYHHQQHQQRHHPYNSHTPITPVASPDERHCPPSISPSVSHPTVTVTRTSSPAAAAAAAAALRYESENGGKSEMGSDRSKDDSDDVARSETGGSNSGSGSDKTRISAILGIDAHPRSPSEREIVRRLEEERA